MEYELKLKSSLRKKKTDNDGGEEATTDDDDDDWDITDDVNWEFIEGLLNLFYS